MERRVTPIWLLLLTILFSSVLHADAYPCPEAKGNPLPQNHPCNDQRAAATEKQPLWQATAGKGSLYLLGSIHFGTPAMYPLPAIITGTFNRTDTLVVEADILNIDPLSMAQLITEKGLYHDGTTLQKQLTPTIWRHLNEAASRLNIPIEMLNRQKPWLVSMTLSAQALNHSGYSEALGIDLHFLTQAQREKKIIELEGVAWQIALFDQLTAQEQAAMLEETLQELHNGKAFFERMFDAWKRGDAAAIQGVIDESTLKSANAARLNTLMITDRNHSMTTALEKLANQGGHYFVVVGAGHLTGNEGIINLLKKRGYQVTQY